MKKTIYGRLLAFGFIVSAAFGCVNRQSASEPEAGIFGQYVRAYTAGIVDSTAAIRIELVETLTEQPASGLFSIKPHVSGTTLWENGNTVVFKPKALVPGENYEISFALRKVSGADKDFKFGISVRKALKDQEAREEPGTGFRVRRCRLNDSHIDLIFSETPTNAATRGMVELEGVARSYVQVQDSLVRVYFEGRKADMKLTVYKGVKNAAGETLKGDYTKLFSAAEQKPAVRIPVSGTILPDKDNLLLPFSAANLSSVELRVVKIYENNVLMFLQDNELNGKSYLRRSGRLVFRGDIPLESEGDLHDWNDHCLNLGGLIRQEPGAIYSVRISFRQDQSLWGGKEPMRGTSDLSGKPSAADEAVWDTQDAWYWDNFYDWSQYRWEDADDPATPSYYMDANRFPGITVLSSDIGLIAEYAGGEDLSIAATDLMSARPLGGVSLDVYDFQLQKIGSAKTGADGLASVKVSRRPFAIVGKAGGSTAYLKLSSERSLSRFDVGGEVLQDGLKAYIYGERGVWRPGDTLHLTAIVFDRQNSIPDAHPASLEVYTPEGQFYSRLVRRGKDNFYSFDLPTSPDDPTGYWNAYFKIGSLSCHKTLHIESIKPNRLKINTSIAGEPLLEAGKSILVKTEASWLSGGAAGSSPARAAMTLRRKGASPFKGFEKYRFFNPASEYQDSEYELYSGTLSADGSLGLQVKLPETSGAPGMLQAFVVTSVTESGGDESFVTATLPYSPFSSYVGIRIPEGDYLETDKDQNIAVAVLDPRGKRVSGHKVEYSIFKTGWSWWWDKPGKGSFDSWVGGSSVKKISSGKIVSGTSDSNIKFRVDYPEWGKYLILARDLASGHVSGCEFTVDWPDYRGRADRQDPENMSMLTFSTDKDSYKAGEKATIYIPAASGAQVLVSLENGSGVIRREWVAAENQQKPYSFTVTADMAPNFYAHITLVRPYSATKGGQMLRQYGVRRILVDNPDSRLDPVLKVPEVIRPGEKFSVKVSEKHGKQMTYTLAIVDEGLLDLTAFKTPDPHAALYRPEALSVKTWDLYDRVIGAWNGSFASVSAVGGDEEAMVSARKDNRFNPVVLYLPPRTLKSGTDNLQLRLPMYVGSVRVMLIAGHAGAYGSTQARVPVRAPLMSLSTLPRAVGTGEKFSLPVNVFTAEDGPAEASVEVKTEGPVKLAGKSVATAVFGNEKDALVHFALEALDKEGPASVSVTVKGGGFKASEKISFRVMNPHPEFTRVRKYALKAGESAEVEAGSSVQLSAFPALDAHAMFSEMKNYPYNCSEQLSSKGLTMLNLKPLLDDKDRAELDTLIPEIISALYARQNADGGFSYWGGGSSQSWVSSMAGLFLVQASKAGYKVEAGVLKSWKQYQDKMSKTFRIAGTSVFSCLDQAFRLYTQTAAGEDAIPGMNRLRESSGIGDRASWMLAAAYALAGKQQIAGNMISGIGRDYPDYAPDELSFGGSFRDRMVSLNALALNGKVGDALSLAGDALTERSLSTQESAFAAIAYGHLYQKIPTTAIKAKVEGKELVSASSFATARVSKAGVVENNSDGPLYLTVSRTSREASSQAVSSGLGIEVRYIDDNGVELNPASLRQGTRFRAQIKVSNLSPGRDLENLALSFGIPCGWEIINDRMFGAAQDGWDHKDIRDLRVDWFFTLPSGRSKSFTVQLRAAYEGSFALPATVCSAMYEPSITAGTASGTAVVTR